MSVRRTSARALIAEHQGRPLVIPGIGTPLEARFSVAAGFQAVYQSGYATASWRHGQPDVGLIALEETTDALESVAEAVDVPIFCDADTGYGDVANVTRAVRRLERAGASAIQFEDQAWPKKCGHMEGKVVIPAVEHARKIAAAVRARQDPETIIIARTDALAPLGMREALDRMQRYADAGADVLFVDAPSSVEDLEQITSELAGHVLVANMSESGRTPLLTAAEFYEIGFQVVLFPTSALRIAARSISDFYAELARSGDSRTWVDRMMSLDELNDALGLHALQDLEAEILAEVGA